MNKIKVFLPGALVLVCLVVMVKPAVDTVQSFMTQKATTGVSQESTSPSQVAAEQKTSDVVGRKSKTDKGVVYLPIVSVSSYLPIAAQVLLMILVISLSGMFGAWLMFQRLAKNVQLATEHIQKSQKMQVPTPMPMAASVIGPNIPFAIPTSVNATASVKIPKVKPGRIEVDRRRSTSSSQKYGLARKTPKSAPTRSTLLPTSGKNETTKVKKRTIFVKKDASTQVVPEAIAPKLDPGPFVDDRPAPTPAPAQAKRKNVLALGRTQVRGEKKAVAKEAPKDAPQSFLANDWFPMDK